MKPENPALQEYSKRPDFAMGPHVAALGLTFANDAKLGANYANGAFVGEHGSWNRVPVSGYKVAYVPFGDNGFPVKGAKTGRRADRIPRREGRGAGPPGRRDHRRDRCAVGGGRCREYDLAGIG